jgi:hypothetical protein
MTEAVWILIAWSLISSIIVVSAVMSNKLVRKGWEEHEYYGYE